MLWEGQFKPCSKKALLLQEPAPLIWYHLLFMTTLEGRSTNIYLLLQTILVVIVRSVMDHLNLTLSSKILLLIRGCSMMKIIFMAGAFLKQHQAGLCLKAMDLGIIGLDRHPKVMKPIGMQ